MPVSPVWEDPRVQRGMSAQLERRAHLRDGERAIGWKLVFNHAAAQARHDIDRPLVAFMTDRVTIASGATIPSLGWTKLGLEPEIVVHIGHDLPPRCGVGAAHQAIAGLGAGIEVIDVDGPAETLEDVLARGAFFRAAVLGALDTDRAGGEMDGIVTRVSRNGVEIGHNADPAAAIGGDLPALVAHVSDLLGAFGESLRAGDVLLTGALTSPLYPDAGDEIRVEMLPLGSLTVRLEAAA